MSDPHVTALGPMARYLVHALGVAGICDEYRALRDRRFELAGAQDFDSVVHEFSDLGEEMDDVGYEIARALVDAADSPDDGRRRPLDAELLRSLRDHRGLSDA